MQYICNNPGKSKDNLRNTLHNFWGTNLICDLSRQWVLKDDAFSYKFNWLPESITEAESKEWVLKGNIVPNI